MNFRHWVVKYIQLPLVTPPKYPGADPDVWNSYEFRYSGDSVGGFGELNYMRTPGGAVSGAVYTYQYRDEGFFGSTEDIVSFLASEVRPGDQVVIMSNGGFDNIHNKLLERLRGGKP